MVNLFGPGAFGCARPSIARPAFSPSNAPGDLDDWFKDCSSELARDGTEWRAAALNALIANLRVAIRKSGVVPDNTSDQMLALALRSQRLNYVATVGGSAGALTVTLDPEPDDWPDLIGVPLRLRFATAIGNNATLSVAGIAGTRNITRASGEPSVAGDVSIGQIAELVYDGTNVQISNINSALLPTAAGQMFTASGNLIVPANKRVLFVEAVGGGGQGGGSYDSPVNIGSGGGAGGYAAGFVFVAPGQVIPVTVGLGGFFNNVGANGADGGASSFGSFLEAPGGVGGGCGVAPIGGDGGVPVIGSNPSAFFFQAGGDGEDKTVITGPNGQYGGFGGVSFFGGGARSSRTGGTGGGAFGAGGPGARQGVQVAGGGGSQGIVIVRW